MSWTAKILSIEKVDSEIQAEVEFTDGVGVATLKFKVPDEYNLKTAIYNQITKYNKEAELLNKKDELIGIVDLTPPIPEPLTERDLWLIDYFRWIQIKKAVRQNLMEEDVELTVKVKKNFKVEYLSYIRSEFNDSIV